MGGVSLELSRELLLSACTDASLFFSADIGQVSPGRAGAEGDSTEPRWGGLTGLPGCQAPGGCLQSSTYFVLTSCFKIKLSTRMSTYCL